MVRNLLIAATVGALALGATSCASGPADDEATAKAGDLCGIAGDSTAKNALTDLLGTSALETDHDGDVSEAAKEMKDGLTHPLGAGDESGSDVCSIALRDQHAGDDLTFSFAWRYAFSLEETSETSPGSTFYNLDGAVGESSTDRARIYVPCTPPGDSASPDRDRFLLAQSESALPRNRDAKANPRDNQMTALHAVARKMAHEVGCANEPLKAKTDLTHYDTLQDAARAKA
ncbi:hypothetical protein ABT381_23485 [Streptomyces sp. NPDC000151]|uniref:hypothetical protein n=1 Tax=Streptomyces sp. NPDC000151 TaxID=3154244 RepID=UPI003319C383